MERNFELRALRESHPSPTFAGEPMSRSELAEAVNAELWRATGRRFALDAHTLARYERGAVRWPNAAYRSALRAVLGASNDAELGFMPTRRGASASAENPVRAAVEAAEESAELDRRDFARAGFAALVTGVNVGQRDPLDYDEELRGLQAIDVNRGPEEPIINVATLLRSITNDLRTSRGTDRAALLRVAARAAEFAGFLHRDLGEPDRSLFWHDRAMDWAQENHDQPMQAYVLLRKAQAAYDGRDAARMLGLARAARRFERVLSTGLKAEILQQEARGEAMLGLSDHGIRAKLDEAKDLLAGPRSEEPHDAPGSRYSGALLDLQIAVCLTEAGHPRHAVGAYRAFLSSHDSSTRDRAYFSTLMATALALSGEPDEAAVTVCAALAVAIKTGSRRTIREANNVAAVLRPWRNRSTVRDLDAALADAVSP
ncbi:hypothetical protein GCM10009609_39960 [Pseudonocardia aurantiaca]|uniref:Transcriptional regulator n=1 Tax=Pseudonocardia aurantiaca TaxID=75290 RepID=A0ABW4FNF9_9PSEU